MTGLYRDSGLEIYEKSHYSQEEHTDEVEKILKWYSHAGTRILDIGCSGGLHALEFAKRGFYVTGVDIEPSAIQLAKIRANNMHAEFRVIDIEKDELDMGGFDLIYSIGNVLSHVSKENLPDVLLKIRRCLDKNGTFLFDVLINAEPFQEEIVPGEDDIQIIWKRKIDEKTGRISMDGIFLESGFFQHFEVWGYTVDEIVMMLISAGFGNIEFSEKLDFEIKNKTKNPISLYFRARIERP